MSACEFARWLQLVARWDHPPEARFGLLADVTARTLVAVIEYEGAKAHVEIGAGTPARQVHADLDEFAGRLVVAAYRRERARSLRRKAAYEDGPAPN